MIEIRRSPENPIVRPGLFPWRRVAAFNPGAIHENGRFYLAIGLATVPVEELARHVMDEAF